MKIEGVRTLAGPNTHTHNPALVPRVGLEELDGRESRDLAGFNASLLALVPGLDEQHCARGRGGGFYAVAEEAQGYNWR